MNRFNDIRIHGTGGSLVASTKNYAIDLYSGGDDQPEIIKLERESSFRKEMKHFLSCINNNTEPKTSGVEERNSLAVIEAGYRSMREDQAVKVEMREN
jgi:predicted dehydrogenase